MQARHGIGLGLRETPVPELFESKLHPPPPRLGLVARTALVDRLDASSDLPITVVVAPPGYGKTTLLSEWSRRHPSRFAWLSIDPYDNDLGRLAWYIAAALDRVGPIDRELLRPTASQRSAAAVASRIVGAMSGMKDAVVLVLDHVESLHNNECLDAIAEIALHLPGGSRPALATRVEPPLPMARLRAGRDIMEIGIDDLAMSNPEARMLLEAAGVQLADSDMDPLIERAEGWPVGLYLGALALNAGGSREHAGVPFSGDDRLIAEYLRTEVLDRLSDADVAFLTQTAVLSRMSGRLCDAVLDDTHSDEILESLARSNLLLVALDRHGEWYRYHHLFRELLKAELDRREPELVPVLHVRAAKWYEANGMAELAVDHAQAGGDAELVNGLMLLNAQKTYAAGRVETVRRWMTWLKDRELIEQYPALAVLGALFYSNIGEPGEAERWAVAAEQVSPSPVPPNGSCDPQRREPERILPDGSTLASWRAVLRAYQGRDGVEALRRDAESALDGLSAVSGLRSAALVARGLAFLFEGDPDRADPIFAHAVDVGQSANVGPAVVVALAERGFYAIGRDDWQAVEAFVDEGLSISQQLGLDDYPDSALAFILATNAAMHRGDREMARDYLTRVVRVRPLLTWARPFISVQALLELARTYVALEDTAGAREVLRQTRDILHQRPELGVLPKHVDELESRLETLRTGRVGASSLTAAELRLVPFLPTHLTFPQIGARLHISRNTAKTHAISIYQKLGVSSRDEAIGRLQEIGLLGT